jgi:type IV pilus assembly protein PilW
MVTIAITMFLVAAAAYVYLGTRETQRAIDRNAGNTETGTFVLQLMGRDIMKGGYYPANITRATTDEPFPKLTGYLPYNGGKPTDWASPTPQIAYIAGIFGCEGTRYDPTANQPCGTASATAPDSVVVNYFTNDTMNANSGDRYDCAGADAGNSASNSNRRNPNDTSSIKLTPLQPLFVSNRYALSDATQTMVDGQGVTTRSLACVGNGSGDNAGSSGNPYQPIVQGIEDMQITYGVFGTTSDTVKLGSRTPDKYLTASQVSNLTSMVIDLPMVGPTSLNGWSRVVSVRICVLAQSLGGSPKVAATSAAERQYTDCKGAVITQDASDKSLRKRFVQEFAVRNRLNQSY